MTHLEKLKQFDVSVVRHQHSYGGNKGLYEVGVFRNGSMATPKGWNDEVKGWLPPLLVCDTLLELEDSEYHDNTTVHNRSVEIMKLHDHPPSLKSLINSN